MSALGTEQTSDHVFNKYQTGAIRLAIELLLL